MRLMCNSGNRCLIIPTNPIRTSTRCTCGPAKATRTRGSAHPEARIRCQAEEVVPIQRQTTMRFSSMTVPTVAFSVVSSAPLALTSTDCAACPITRLKSTRAVCCTCSSMLVLVQFNVGLSDGFESPSYLLSPGRCQNEVREVISPASLVNLLRGDLGRRIGRGHDCVRNHSTALVRHFPSDLA